MDSDKSGIYVYVYIFIYIYIYRCKGKHSIGPCCVSSEPLLSFVGSTPPV